MARALAVLVAALLVVACGTTADAPIRATPSASVSPTPRPNPTAGPATYTSVALGYRIDLPQGWRRSDCLTTPGLAQPPGSETFTPASVDEESGSDIGPHQEVVELHVEDAASVTAREWLERLGGSISTRLEPATLDGKDAVRMTENGVILGYALTTAGRLYALVRAYARNRGPNPYDATAMTLMSSFHVLTDPERVVAQRTLATASPVPVRTADEVARTIARGFAQKDIGILASVASPCPWHGGEQAGSEWKPRGPRLAEIQRAFANGLVVTAQTTLEPQTPERVFVAGTWNDPNDPDRKQKAVKHAIERLGQTWYWTGWMDLLPAR